jgi:pimeloyl-ACP methyl ester carboxylesterase
MKKNRSALGAMVIITAAIILMVSGCKKKTEDQVVNGNVAGFYEFIMAGQSAGVLTKYYQITLIQNGTEVGGEISVHHVDHMVAGTIKGSVTGGTLAFSATMDLSSLSFSFSGSFDATKSPLAIEGTFTFPDKTTMQGSLLKMLEDYHCDDGGMDINAYVFRKVVSSPNPTGPPVIFVHGMIGKMGNWDTIVMNLSAEFKAKHDVYEFQYNWKDSIIINGRILKDSVERYGLVNPIIIAHSMGGLVSRGYIVSGGAITKLVTLGTPHLGTPLVNLINIPGLCKVNYPGPRNMYPSEGYIQKILHDPLDIAVRSKYYVIEGQLGMDTVVVHGNTTLEWKVDYYATVDKLGYQLFYTMFPQPNDGLVPVSSGLFEGAAVNRPLPVQFWLDHFHLIKPLHATQIMQYINTL